MQPELGQPEDVSFKANVDGTEQRYVQMLPLGLDSGKTCDVLIVFHGHGSDRWQYVRQERAECKGARDVAARHGIIFIAPEYRGDSWMGPQAEADVVQIIEELKQQHRVGRVILCGGSMGGTAVLILASLHPELVNGVVSQNGLANFNGYAPAAEGIGKAIQSSFGGTEEMEPAEYRKRSAELHAGKFTMPVAFTIGEKDMLVPPASALRLAKIIQRHHRKILLLRQPEGGHATNYEDTIEALEFVVGGGRAAALSGMGGDG